MVSHRCEDNALTTETPTPCKPPDTLYELASNLPPACRTVMTTSAVERPSSGWMSTGIPRPVSVALTIDDDGGVRDAGDGRGFLVDVYPGEGRSTAAVVLTARLHLGMCADSWS